MEAIIFVLTTCLILNLLHWWSTSHMLLASYSYIHVYADVLAMDSPTIRMEMLEKECVFYSYATTLCRLFAGSILAYDIYYEDTSQLII